jgi:hypothetical protein
MIPIIGLLGRSRAGKDTAALVIIKHLGVDNTCISRLSQPLKDAARALYGFSASQVEDEEKEIVDGRYGVTPRVCIQKLCDHMMAVHGTNFFSNLLYHKFDNNVFTQKCLIIPDIRYPHDITEIHKRGGIVIKIDRPPHPDVPRHAWEDTIDDLCGDYVVVNDSTKEIFEKRINQTLRNMEL